MGHARNQNVADRLELQLARIEAIQARLRQVLMDETLDDVEALVAELGSRFNTVLGDSDEVDPRAVAQLDRIRGIGQAQRELAALAQGCLRALGGRLAGARDQRRMSDGYTVRAAKAESAVHHRTDLTG
jgi:hypothetical protein